MMRHAAAADRWVTQGCRLPAARGDRRHGGGWRRKRADRPDPTGSWSRPGIGPPGLTGKCRAISRRLLRWQGMASPLLETKLYVPRPRRGLVSRPRLSERLDQGAESKLTLVSAPAGFGKTTLLAEWLAASRGRTRSAAGSRSIRATTTPRSFWTYLIAALQSVDARGRRERPLACCSRPSRRHRVGPHDAAQRAQRDRQRRRARARRLPRDRRPDVHGGMAFLLEHLPPQVHLVIASRADPPLPLARLRARGELVELRAADLRFTPDEAAAFLNEVMGLDLARGGRGRPREAHRRLDRRRSSWRRSRCRGATTSPGSSRSSPAMTATSSTTWSKRCCSVSPNLSGASCCRPRILDRLSGPLCDAVTGQDGGTEMLETLERGNLFVVPLDDRRQWYRYHHLFADVLRAPAWRSSPTRSRVLHRRASEWYEENGDRRRRSTTPWPPGTSRARPTSSSLRSRRRARVARRPVAPLAGRAPGRRDADAAVLSDWLRRVPPRQWRGRGGRRAACGTPSDGWRRRARPRGGQPHTRAP